MEGLSALSFVLDCFQADYFMGYLNFLQVFYNLLNQYPFYEHLKFWNLEQTISKLSAAFFE